jgi:hypothetical protein
MKASETSFSFWNPNQIFGTYKINEIIIEADHESLNSYYFAEAFFAGGTGLFADASGTGSFQIYQKEYFYEPGQTFRSWVPASVNYLNATINTPVPEADTSAMFLMGVGVMGFMARRRKNEQA